jgi:hypothetical protein
LGARAPLRRIVRVFLDEDADAVFGSRFAGSEVRRAMPFRHELGNRLLTFLTNLVTHINLTDMETCTLSRPCEPTTPTSKLSIAT